MMEETLKRGTVVEMDDRDKADHIRKINAFIPEAERMTREKLKDVPMSERTQSTIGVDGKQIYRSIETEIFTECMNELTKAAGLRC